MRLGKLDNDVLKKLVLDKFPRTRIESYGSPAIGEDCARLDLGGDLTVLSTDPITSAGIGQLGRLSVHVNCNDAAAAGAEPVGLLITLLLPPDTTEADIARIADDVAAACRAAHVDVLGGHTEVTDAVTRPVTNTTVVARCPVSGTLPGMRPGDDLVLTKYAALEGTLLILEDRPQYAQDLTEKQKKTVQSIAEMLSVVPEGLYAARHGATAMHDITEGGVYGAVWEMAERYGCGVTVFPRSVPFLPETEILCQAAGIDPFRLIGSGSMLIACKHGDALVKGLSDIGIPASVIGKVTERGVYTDSGEAIEPPAADEFYRLFV